MFNNLLESKPKKEKRGGGTVASIVLHSVLIAGAVYATANAAIQNEKPRQEKIDFVETAEGRAAAAQGRAAAAAAARRGGRAAAAEGLPGAHGARRDPGRHPGHRPDQEGDRRERTSPVRASPAVSPRASRAARSGRSDATSRTSSSRSRSRSCRRPGSTQPRYPDMLRSAGVEGEVLAQFVVDTTGRAEAGSLKVLKSTHDLFIAVGQERAAAACVPAGRSRRTQGEAARAAAVPVRAQQVVAYAHRSTSRRSDAL